MQTFHMGGAPSAGSPPNQAMFLPNLPQNPPPIPFNCPPSIQNLMAPIAGFTLLALQQKAGENPVRAYYFNLCSSNGWNNQHIQILLSEVANLVELKMAFQNMPWEHAVPSAADEMLAIMVGLVARDTPALHQYITSPAQQNAVQVAGAKMQDIQNAVMNLRQQQQQRNMGGGMGGYNVNTYANNQMRRGGTSFGHNPGQNYNPTYGNNQQPTAHVGTGGPFGNIQINTGGYGGGYGGNPGTGASSGAATIWASNDQPAHRAPGQGGSGYGHTGHQDRGTLREQESVTGEPGGRVETKFSDKPKFPPPPNFHKRRQQVENVPEFTSLAGIPDEILRGGATLIQYNGQVFHNVDEESEWPKTANKERPWDHLLLEDYSEVMPAHLSPWKVETTLENPYHIVYNPSTHILMHVRRPDGTVLEYATEWKSAMDYLSNELDPRLRRAGREVKDLSNNEIREADWIKTTSLKPHPSLKNQLVEEQSLPTAELTEGDELKEALPVETTDKVLLAHSLVEAEAKSSMAAQIAKIDRSAVREYKYDEVDPNIANQGDRGRIVTLSQFKDYPSFLSMYQSLKDRMNPDVWAEVDQRVTAAIMTTLSKTMSLEGWGIESVFDVPELLTLLGEQIGDNVVEVFNKYAEFNIKSSLRVLDESETQAYMYDFLGVGPQDCKNHVAFVKRINVLTLPWKFEELSISFGNGNGGMIGENVMPDLYKTVKDVFERHEHEQPQIAQYLIRTRDGKTMQVLRGAFNTGTLLIFQIEME